VAVNHGAEWYGPNVLAMTGDDCTTGAAFRESTGTRAARVGYRPPRPSFYPTSPSIAYAMTLAGMLGESVSFTQAQLPPRASSSPTAGYDSTPATLVLATPALPHPPMAYADLPWITADGAMCMSGVYVGGEPSADKTTYDALSAPGDSEAMKATRHWITGHVGGPSAPTLSSTVYAFFRITEWWGVVNPTAPPEEQYEDTVHAKVEQMSEADYIAAGGT
jgi:hypothetical protein